MKHVLITGGARSGKSDFAQKLAGQSGSTVLFVATAEPRDEEMKSRIAAHRNNRPAGWSTLEATTQLGTLIAGHSARTILIDCVTILVANVMEKGEQSPEQSVDGEIEALIACMRQNPAHFIIVTNEVGLGLVPATPLGRQYRDLLGRANQKLAAFCDEVYFMVSGIPNRIK